MRITRVRAYRQEQPFRRGGYRMGSSSSAGFESLVVRLDTDEGIAGHGETSTINPVYADAFAAGARAGVAELAPSLLGVDPTQPGTVTALVDGALRGHPYVKSAIDMACWDAKARAADRPLWHELGARHGDAVALYNVVIVSPLEDALALTRELLAEGYQRIQVKVGTDPIADAERLAAVRDLVGRDVVLYADANGAFTTRDARRFLRASRELDYVLEQPCRTYAECASLRGDCDRPLVLDESIVTLEDLLRAARERVADGVTLKLQRIGGVSRAQLLRDVAVEHGLDVTIEDAGGSSLATAAFVHLGLGTPERHRAHMVDFHRWVTIDHGTGLPPSEDGVQRPPDGPGLGIEVDHDALGEPAVDTHQV
ncbi:MAG: mandelate racemase/muconate lactonizing enzyme family protein [Gaiella sp.]